MDNTFCYLQPTFFYEVSLATFTFCFVLLAIIKLRLLALALSAQQEWFLGVKQKKLIQRLNVSGGICK